MKNVVFKKLILSILVAGTAIPYTYGMKKTSQKRKITNQSDLTSTFAVIKIQLRSEKTLPAALELLKQMAQTLTSNVSFRTTETVKQWNFLKNDVIEKLPTTFQNTASASFAASFKDKAADSITAIDNALKNVQVSTQNNQTLKSTITSQPVFTGEPNKPVVKNLVVSRDRVEPVVRTIITVTLPVPQIVEKKEIQETPTHQATTIIQKKDEKAKTTGKKINGKKMMNFIQALVPEDPIPPLLNQLVLAVIKGARTAEVEKTLQLKTPGYSYLPAFLVQYAKHVQTLKSLITLKKGASLNKTVLDEAYYGLYKISRAAENFTCKEHGKKNEIHVTFNLALPFKGVFTTIIENLTLCVDSSKNVGITNSTLKLVTLCKKMCPELDTHVITEKLTVKLKELYKDCTETLTEFEKSQITGDQESQIKIVIALLTNKKTDQKETKPITTSVKNRMELFDAASRKEIYKAILSFLTAENIPNDPAFFNAVEPALTYFSGDEYVMLYVKFWLAKNKVNEQQKKK